MQSGCEYQNAKNDLRMIQPWVLASPWPGGAETQIEMHLWFLHRPAVFSGDEQMGGALARSDAGALEREEAWTAIMHENEASGSKEAGSYWREDSEVGRLC